MSSRTKNIETFDEVLALCKSYLSKEESISFITRAYEFAREKHEGQFRKTGEPYIIHLINVAYYLAELQVGPSTIAAGFLHDTIEDCGVKKTELAAAFNEDVATLVEAVSKVSQLSYKTEEEFQAENHRKIFIAMAKDIRVIIIKLADRLHNMRTLYAQPLEKQKKIAKETLEVYAPIAHRLGINTIKSELEDLSLKYLEADKYYYIASLLSQKENERFRTIEVMSTRIETLLKEQNIPFKLSGRVKSIYSIYKKMYLKERRFEEIYDLQALRIITDTDTHCYEILGHIHAAYRPIPGRFKDYIAMPKPNLYQSLHTTLVGDDGNIFEIQIRTKLMDDVAEAGVAAHWRYKENVSYDPAAEQKQIEERLHWFRELVSISNEEEQSSTAKEYMESLRKDIFEANVYILTPKGRVIDLPNGATPLDFAYKIHTEIGHRTIGAVVNGVLVPLSTVLKTGDVVDIRTSKTTAIPNEDWLKIVKTNYARNHIKKALMRYNNQQRREEIIAMGRNILEEHLNNDKALIRQVLKRLDDKKFLQSVNFEDIDTLFVAVANKSTNIGNIVDRALNDEDLKKEKVVTPFAKEKTRERNANKMGVLVPGIDSVAISFSQCCSPIPGDKIVGYISKGQGMKIHRADCPNIKTEEKRLLPVEWDYDYVAEHSTLHYADIQIRARERNGLLVEILNLMSQLKVSVNSVNSYKHDTTFTAIVQLCIQVYDLSHLNEVCTAIHTNVNGIQAVTRFSRN